MSVFGSSRSVISIVRHASAAMLPVKSRCTCCCCCCCFLGRRSFFLQGVDLSLEMYTVTDVVGLPFTFFLPTHFFLSF